jgi:multiple sugar transport system permease protein
MTSTQTATIIGANTRGSRPRAAKERPLSIVVSTSVMVAFAIYFLVPLWWLVVAATKTRPDLTSTFGLWFSPNEFALFDNLHALFTTNGGAYIGWAWNSLLYAGLGGALATLIALMMGYALAKYEFRGRGTIFSIVLGAILIPITALALPLFLVFGAVNMTDTFWAVFLPSLVSPFGVYLGRIYASAAVPDELLEAARLDGSSELRTFFTVSLRLMSPAVVTIFLFQFTQIWNNFFLPLVMLQDDALYPVTLGLYAWNSQVYLAPELRLLVIVGSLVAIVPVIIAFLLLQLFWRSGLAAGSIK